MTAPVVKVEVGFGSTWQTEPGSITWTDVTSYVLFNDGIRATRGASAARGQVDAGSCGLTLLNTDRRFDPLHTTGPYYGNLKPGVPVRVRGTPSGQPTTAVWRGTVTKWPQRYDIGNTYAFVPLEGYDGFDKLSRAKIPQAVYPVEVLADAPVAYWRLDEQSGATVMVDSSGHDVHGIYDNAITGEDPLIEDGNGASMFCEHVGDNRGQYKGGDLPTQAPITLEAWVKLDRDLTETHEIIVIQRDNAFGSGLVINVETSANGSPNGEVVVNFFGLGGFYKFRGSTRVDDGNPHHIAFTMATTAQADCKLYVDGVEETKTTLFGATAGSWSGHYLWVIGNAAASTLFDFGLAGNVDEVAVYDAALSAARVLAHYEAGSDALTGQRSDERIDYLLDLLDWPVGLRDLEVGQTFLGPATFKAGDSALEYFRLITTTEDGLLFIEADGTLRFLDRYWRFLDPLAVTSQFTFSDAIAGRGYAEFELDLDDELLANAARITRRGGIEQTAQDQASIDTYGYAEVQESDLLFRTDAESLSFAEWVVATRSMPLPRVPKIRVPLHGYSAADQKTILSLDLGHRVSTVRTPQGVGSAINLDFVIDGIEQEISQGAWWWTAYVSPIPQETLTPFIWGVSAWGGTDAWAY